MKTKIAGVGVVAFLIFAHWWGLVKAPADAMMGDVYRILFVHVPSAWMSMVFFFMNFVGSLVFLIKKKPSWDRFASCAAEVGVVSTAVTLALGSIWGKPTWGVWWTWDPRLTTTALLLILYAGYLIIRQLLEDPEKRAKISSAVALLIFLNVPIVYMSVRWWRSLHQVQSSPKTVAPEMVFALRINAFALLFLLVLFLVIRISLAKREADLEEKEALPPEPVS